MELGEKLRQARLEAGLSQRQIVLIYAGLALGLTALVTVLNQLLGMQIDNYGGLSNLGKKSMLSSVQSMLPFAQSLLSLWKSLGWSAIVYIAGIAGIDQQLYEAAKVDGANRFQCIRHITIPGLVPTYMVMLLMSIAGMLSNGMEQYLVFENAINKDVIEVLDLYVYNIGIKSGLIPLSTVVGIFKSLIGVTLLFGANGISKAVRGESII